MPIYRADLAGSRTLSFIWSEESTRLNGYKWLYSVCYISEGSFLQAQITGVVTDHKVAEASGCAASRTHPGILYTLNDHSGKAEIYVLATNGTLVATYDIHGAHNHDWEDIAVGPCDAHDNTVDCIYIGKFVQYDAAKCNVDFFCAIR